MQRAKRTLEDIWNKYDEYLMKAIGHPIHQILGDILKKRPIQRTAPWVELEKEAIIVSKTELDVAASRLAALELEDWTSFRRD